jgi:hypothetical protein
LGGVSCREIVSQINPLLPDDEKLNIMNLSKHKKHIPLDCRNLNTDMSMAEEEFISTISEVVRALTVR